MNKIVVGLSGGVDSAVTAYLLRKQGYEVWALYMRQFDSVSEMEAAGQVAAALGVHFAVVDYREVFRCQVVERFQRERVGDHTPNPCCWCNPTVKFKCLFDYAAKVGAEQVATGHYAQIKDGQLYRAVDSGKDQSYFLAGLTREQLQRVQFPLGGMTKVAVRKLAAQIKLPVANKPDSTDLCFPVGTHGLTIGQGVKQGGAPAKLYYLGNGRIGKADDPALFRRELTVSKFNWQVPAPKSLRATAQIRSRHTGAECQVSVTAGRVKVTFDAPVRAITAGQWCVLYQGEQVLGGGEIDDNTED